MVTVLELISEARNPKSETISNVQNTNVQNKIGHLAATVVWHLGNVNSESVRRCSEPALSEAARDRLVSYFRDNAGQQASGNGTGVVEIRISDLARLT